MEVLNWYMDDAKSGGGRNEAKLFTKEQIEKMGKSWSQNQCWSSQQVYKIGAKSRSISSIQSGLMLFFGPKSNPSNIFECISVSS